VPASLKGRLPPTLVQCFGCYYHVYDDVKTCPHCGSDVAKMQKRHDRAVAKAKKAMANAQAILDRLAARSRG
jgi:hypothetical protein